MRTYEIEHTNVIELISPIQNQAALLHERWANKSLSDIYREMPILPEHIEINDNSFVETVTLDYVGAEGDDSTIVMALPYLNGWTPHHYIRARTMQEIVAPNSKVVVLPAEADSVSLNDSDRQRLKVGDAKSVAEKQMKALEMLNLGKVAMTGYSWGAITVLNIVETGSDRLEVVGANMDEIPSAMDRDVKLLKKDFMASGGILALRTAVRSSDIPALSEVMSLPRMVRDLIRFGAKGMFDKDSKLIANAMTDSAMSSIMNVAEQVGPDKSKVGYIEGSRIFNPINVHFAQELGARVVEYVGRGFLGHASADNVILHAGMVNDGLKPTLSE